MVEEAYAVKPPFRTSALEKMLFPENVLLLERSVEEAAVMVKELPAVMAVVLMVARVPVRRLVPIEVVAITFPLASVARSALDVAERFSRANTSLPVKVLLLARSVEEA